MGEVVTTFVTARTSQLERQREASTKLAERKRNNDRIIAGMKQGSKKQA